MSGQILANVYANEDTLVGSPVNITFPWKARQTVITNDSTLNNLTVTLVGQNLTLKPTETLTTIIHVKTVTLNGTGDYRVWAFG